MENAHAARAVAVNPASPASALRRIAWLAAAAYAAVGLGAMLVLSPSVPYADPWRFYARFLTAGFPADVVAADNGHVELLPNLVRVLELHLFAADQTLQIGLATTLAIGLGVLLWRWLGRPAGERAAAVMLVLAVGLFWLGNGRKLAHGNESVPLFLVLLAVATGLRLLSTSDTPDRRAVLGATLCATAATFCFGAGFAAFPAFGILLACHRVPLRRLAPLVLAAATCGTVLALGGDSRPDLGGSVFEHLDALLRWLGAPFVWILSPLLDPQHAARLPWAPLRAVAEPIATVLHGWFGAPHLAQWPAAAFGIIALVGTGLATGRAMSRNAPGLVRFAIGLAWFGISVGSLVVALRLSYFRAHPDQITTQRYVPWSMLVWIGLLLVRVAHARSAAMATGLALAFAAVLAPSQIWTGRYAHKQLVAAELTALGATVGVLPRDFDLVETVPGDLDRAVPLLRRDGSAMFAWPETRAFAGGSTQPLEPLAIAGVELAPVDNRYPGNGCLVAFDVPGGAPKRLVLTDRSGRPVGLAVRLPFMPHWLGFVRGAITAEQLGAARVR